MLHIGKQRLKISQAKMNETFAKTYEHVNSYPQRICLFKRPV